MKKSGGNFLELRSFTDNKIDMEIKIPKNSIKPLSKISLKDKASGKMFVIDKEYADILKCKL